VGTDHGGGGHRLIDCAYAYEGLGAALPDGGVLLAAGAHLFGVAACLERVGSDDQKARWLPRLASGECLATVAATEVDAGSDVAAVTTRIEETGRGVEVTGDKAWVTQAGRAGLFFVVGRTGDQRGLSVALVPRSDGVVAGEAIATIGLRGARLAPVTFREAAGERLGKAGAGMAVFQTAMVLERALVLAFRLGAMDRSLDEAVVFVQRRKVGGKRIAEHQAVTHRLARMKLRLETARLLCYRAAWALDRGDRAHLEAAMAKWHLAESAVESSVDAIRLRGGAGYVSEARLGEVLDDALGGGIHSGTADVLAGIVAGWMGV
jgi:alkylation response protein AidB-like acyl-CoA dehydrogenase